MGSILKVKDEKGNFVDIPAIKGDDGKSAYEHAREGGFIGTEEDFNKAIADMSPIAGHTANKNNPHEVTAEQVGALKIYYSFAAFNSELGTDFGNDTPIEDIIQAMPDNTGLKADINTVDIGQSGTSIYPAVYGILTIYKIRENRVEVEYVSNAISTKSDYNKRWIGQYNAGVFGGFVQVFTEQYPPSAEQVKAISKTINLVNKDILGITTDGWYYGVQMINVPTINTAGYIRVMTMSGDTNYRVVYWRPHNSSVEYTNVLSGDDGWLGWTEFFTNKGGLITDYLHYKNNLCGLAGDGNYIGFNAGDDSRNLRAFHVRRPSLAPNKEDAFMFYDIVNGVNAPYRIFGEHNKPTGTYTGNDATRTINIGGIGNVLLVTGNGCTLFVTEQGATIVTHGNAGNVGQVNTSYCKFVNGIFTITLSQGWSNASGVTYTYQVL